MASSMADRNVNGAHGNSGGGKGVRLGAVDNCFCYVIGLHFVRSLP